MKTYRVTYSVQTGSGRSRARLTQSFELRATAALSAKLVAEKRLASSLADPKIVSIVEVAS